MLDQLLNIGPVSAAWLEQAGIRTESQLRNVGSAVAFLQVQHHVDSSVSLNLLWALEGAILGIHWTKISAEQKRKLKADLDSLQRESEQLT